MISAHPFVYPPTELIFPEGDDFWHTDIKWDYSVPFEFREVKDKDLSEQAAGSRAQDVSCNRRNRLWPLRCAHAKRMAVSSFWRSMPIRASSIHPEEYGPADYMILYDKDGYYGFFDRIFRSAIVRQKLRGASRAACLRRPCLNP